MGKTLESSTALFSLPIGRSSVVLAANIGLLLACVPFGNAEPETGLIISRDGGNVNVTLDSEASANVSIRRSEDVMVIRVPKSFSPKLVIDSALKKDSVVEESETGEGRTITINSQQIYLMTREHLENPAVPVPSAAVTTRNVKMASKARVIAKTGVDDGIQDAVNNLAIQEDEHPVNLTAKPGKTAALEKPAVITTPVTTSKSVSVLDEAIENLKRETEPSAEALKATSNKDNSTAAEAKPTNAPETRPATNATPSDPESQPLDLENSAHAQAVQTSTGSMLRIVLSLLAVLGLFVAFVRFVLPQLMERYPDFFENLKRQSEQRAESKAFYTGVGKEKTSVKQESRTFGSFFAPSRQDNGSKKGYLERLNVDGDHFNVLTSTTLGKGKELHLVEIRGRQFMVATTPYTVTLLKDLTDEINEPSLTGLMDDTLRTGESQFTGESTPKSETVAYLSDTSSATPTPKSNPYASVPDSKLSKNQPQPQNIEASEQVYLKYLNQPGSNHPINGKAIQPSYVDAEEVVVLEDYDDTYGF